MITGGQVSGLVDLGPSVYFEARVARATGGTMSFRRDGTTSCLARSSSSRTLILQVFQLAVERSGWRHGLEKHRLTCEVSDISGPFALPNCARLRRSFETASVRVLGLGLRRVRFYLESIGH